MKKFLILTFAFFAAFAASAQELVVQHSAKGSYLLHTVAPKENFYSLGRMYNVPPKEIAAFNGLQMEKGLSIGQSISIPLLAQNFSQDKATTHPVYYVVGEKEGLYRVSVNNNKVLMANLRKWNSLKTDAVSTGQKLVVGYLVSPDIGVANAAKPVAPEVQEPAKKTIDETITKKEEERPSPRNEPATTEKKTEPVRTEVTKNEPTNTQPPRGEPTKVITAAVNDGNGGYFKTAFDAQVKAQPLHKDEMASAGIFKTASGWQDAKYYALIDGVEPGNVIRIVNPNNNKAIYAKVLDKMTGIRQNQGYDVRISNAAATALDITDTDKFFVRVNY